MVQFKINKTQTSFNVLSVITSATFLQKSTYTNKSFTKELLHKEQRAKKVSIILSTQDAQKNVGEMGEEKTPSLSEILLEIMMIGAKIKTLEL
jgi:hypothetical protein